MDKHLSIAWKTGSQFKVKPNVAYRAMEKVRKANGGNLVPELLVDASRPVSAPLHKEFEWDNKVAGEQFRREQARYIIRSIEVVRAEAPTVQSRAYEAIVIVKEGIKGDKPEPRRVYQTTEDILRDPVSRADLLTTALRDLASLRRKYAGLSELAMVFKAIDATIETTPQSAAG